MASLSLGQSQEFDFVEKLSEDFRCQISDELLLHPHQTLCCGNHLSRDSATHLERERKPCPFCRKDNLKTILDQHFQRQIRALKVRCPRKLSDRCEWVGELGEQERHLETCFEQQEVDCEFSHVGCEARVKRRRMAEHVEENVKTHLSMTCKTLRQLTDTVAQQARTIQDQKDSMQKLTDVAGQQVAIQRQIIAHLKHKGKEVVESELLTKPVFLTPPNMVLKNFSKHKKDADSWYGPPFYSHIGGYKMTLRVGAYGWGDGEGTHVSVGVHLMVGEYDGSLNRQFQGKVTVELLNQREDQRHVVQTFNFNDNDSSAKSEYLTGKSKEKTKLGRGCAKYISHSALSYNESEDTEYVKDDSLEFRITEVTLNEEESEPPDV